MNWAIGIDMYTLMCIKWMTSKNLLYKKNSKIQKIRKNWVSLPTKEFESNDRRDPASPPPGSMEEALWAAVSDSRLPALPLIRCDLN